MRVGAVCLYECVKKLITVLAAVAMAVSTPAVVSAQSTGSLGSLANDATPIAPAEHEPNPRELETLAFANQVLKDVYDRYAVLTGEPPVIKRDAEVSRQAQLGAELTIPRFVEYMGPDNSEKNDSAYPFRAEVLDYRAPYSEVFVCGPAPLSQDQVEEAYQEIYRGKLDPAGEIRYYTSALISYEKPIGGVGYAEAQGVACSYMLLRSERFPFR